MAVCGDRDVTLLTLLGDGDDGWFGECVLDVTCDTVGEYILDVACDASLLNDT